MTSQKSKIRSGSESAYEISKNYAGKKRSLKMVKKYEIETEKYKIQSELLDHKYSVTVSFDDKSLMVPLIKVVKRALDYIEETKTGRKRARELEKKERGKNTNRGGPL